jgi:hypothetical protein
MWAREDIQCGTSVTVQRAQPAHSCLRLALADDHPIKQCATCNSPGYPSWSCSISTTPASTPVRQTRCVVLAAPRATRCVRADTLPQNYRLTQRRGSCALLLWCPLQDNTTRRLLADATTAAANVSACEEDHSHDVVLVVVSVIGQGTWQQYRKRGQCAIATHCADCATLRLTPPTCADCCRLVDGVVHAVGGSDPHVGAVSLQVGNQVRIVCFDAQHLRCWWWPVTCLARRPTHVWPVVAARFTGTAIVFNFAMAAFGGTTPLVATALLESASEACTEDGATVSDHAHSPAQPTSRPHTQRTRPSLLMPARR